MKLFAILAAFFLFAGVFVVAAYFTESNANDSRGQLQKITFIHYKSGYVRAIFPAKAQSSNCYSFLANGAKWKASEQYFINPQNSDGMPEDFVESAVNAGVFEWEKYGGNIFGSGFIDSNAAYIDSYDDGKNTVSFGAYPDSQAIAVTNVWGYFYGAPKTRQLVEWDLLFNDQYFSFGNADDSNSFMDLQNIATHELGHAAGLGDLYNSCTLETMYGYSSEGEISKRSLYLGDIAGIRKLYGG